MPFKAKTLRGVLQESSDDWTWASRHTHRGFSESLQPSLVPQTHSPQSSVDPKPLNPKLLFEAGTIVTADELRQSRDRSSAERASRLEALRSKLGHVGVSENRGPQYSTLNSRILIIRTPKIRYPLFFPRCVDPWS